ncbi:MAG: hypothetical protein RLZZ210_1748 [Pseudomonadota bacterium]|jgi:lipoprotein NlpD
MIDKIFTKITSIATLTILTIGLIGCAGPNYAPVNGRTPSRNPNVKPNNFPNTPPPLPSANTTYNQNAPLNPKPMYGNGSNGNNGNLNGNDIQTNSVSPPPAVYSNEPAPAGYYRVMPGDTLYKIARENNIAPKELIEWNALENPNNLQPYQLVRISSNTSVSNNKSSGSSNSNSNSSNNTTNHVNDTTNKPSNTQNTTNSTNTPVKVSLIWPVRNSTILNKFNGKGIDFSGRIGDPVYAAGDGTVIYANSMRGYGNLVIIAHSSEIVTAYAHLQQINVKEQQKVKQGQTIASLGNTQSEQVKLHFEVRKKSEPVDPIPYIKQK